MLLSAPRRPLQKKNVKGTNRPERDSRRRSKLQPEKQQLELWRRLHKPRQRKKLELQRKKQRLQRLQQSRPSVNVKKQSRLQQNVVEETKRSSAEKKKKEKHRKRRRESKLKRQLPQRQTKRMTRRKTMI